MCSSVCFNPYHKATLASADYEGSVSVWDVNVGTKKASHHEHNKRVWSVVYNATEPTFYTSGSDDSTGVCLCVCVCEKRLFCMYMNLLFSTIILYKQGKQIQLFS